MEWTWPTGTLEDRQLLVSAIAWTIYEEGPFESEEGRASRLLVDALAQRNIEIDQTRLVRILGDISEGGNYGHLIDRIQSESSKRTYTISLAVDPATDPFPPNPFTDEYEEVEEPEPEDETIEDIPVQATERSETTSVESVGTELVPAEVDTVSPTDKLLYASSMIHEVIGDLAHAAAVTQTQQVGRIISEQLSAVNDLVRQNEQLREENSRLRQVNADLDRAYAALRATRNGRVTV